MKVFVSCFLLCWQAVHCNSVATHDFTANSSIKPENTRNNKISSPDYGEGQPKRHFSFSQQFPRIRSRFSYPYPDHLYRVPRRQYRLEDFLWAGSGEGPNSDDNHDGMAWEDGIIVQSSGASAIRITKTMVLYKTVLSTIYPIEMTPTVISSQFHITPSPSSFDLSESLQPSPSLHTSSSSYIDDYHLTPTLHYDSIAPTPSMPNNQMLQTVIFPEDNTHSNSSGSLHDKLSSGSADLRYWVQTTIKAKREAGENPNDMRFQENMQRRLAKVYAEAFKRQFIKTLTGERNSHEEAQFNSSTRNTKTPKSTPMSRQRRWSSSSQYADTVNNEDVYEIDAVDIAHPVYYSEINRMAKAAMNVTVTIMNIVWAQAVNLIHIKYVVYAEGVPIPGFVAAKELNTITLAEMEKEIEHEIVGSKAEALFQPSLGYVSGVSPTPWIVVLLVMVCIMFVILMLTLFMAWKWKISRARNRQDHEEASPTHERQASPVPRHPIEDEDYQNSRQGREEVYSREGSIGREHRVSPSPQENQPSRLPRNENAPQSFSRGDVLDESPRSMTESSDQNTVVSDGRTSSNLLLVPGGSRFTSPQHYKSKGHGISKKITKKKKKKRKPEGLSPVDKYKPPSKEEGPTEFQDREMDEDDFAMSTDVCTNMEKISFGNLDICNDSLARTPSAHAKKVIDSRPSSHDKKAQGSFRQPYESAAANALDDFRAELNFPEQDRDLSEKSFEITDSASMDVTSTRDAEAQTPTRLNRRSPRVRTSPKHRKHIRSPRMSQITSQSEERVVFHDYNSSTEELNPLGRMRKRFHEFLDDAFSVMGSKRDSVKEKGPQSAKVTVSHQVKTKTPGRPWTSHVIREESVRRVRPKSSVILGPPKSAWTAGSERRCHSAKSKSPEDDGRKHNKDTTDDCGIQGDESSARSTSTTPFPGKELTIRQSSSERSKSFIFPKYPAYPDVEICLENDPNRAAGPQSSHFTRSRLPQSDPAVPLIEAIKDEMKRFERVKVSSTSSKAESTSAP